MSDEDQGLGLLRDLLLPGESETHDEFSDAEVDDESARAMAPPVHWPSLSEDEATDQLIELAHWVSQLQERRFPEMVRLPACWDQHPYIVELLQALYDHERASFSSLAPPTAAVGWHMVLRDIEARLRSFLPDLGCRSSVAGGGHTPALAEGVSA